MRFCTEPPMLFTGNAHPELARAIARAYGVELSECEVDRHPDNEPKIKIGANVRGRDTYVIQPTHTTPITMGDNLMELLVMIDALKRASAGRITAVIPYYGFARQDRKDEGRVPITAKLVATLLEVAGASRFLTVDLHAAQIQGFTNLPFDHLIAGPVLRQRLPREIMEPLCIVGADIGAIKRARRWAKDLGAAFACNNKARDSDADVSMIGIIGDVRDRHVIIVDDETSTGKTIVRGAELDLANGALSVSAAITHAKLAPGALELLTDSPLERIFITDTLPQPALPDKFTVCSIDQLLADAIQATYEQTSVSVLLD